MHCHRTKGHNRKPVNRIYFITRYICTKTESDRKTFNKKAFQFDANRPHSNMLCFIDKKFECVGRGTRALYSDVQVEQKWSFPLGKISALYSQNWTSLNVSESIALYRMGGKGWGPIQRRVGPGSGFCTVIPASLCTNDRRTDTTENTTWLVIRD